VRGGVKNPSPSTSHGYDPARLPGIGTPQAFLPRHGATKPAFAAHSVSW